MTAPKKARKGAKEKDMEAKSAQVEKSQEIMKQETAGDLMAVPEGSWGTEGVESKDILLPKVILMQSTSDLVKAGEKKAGSFVSTLTGEDLGGESEPLEFIPLLHTKEWTIWERGPKEKRFAYVKTVPHGPNMIGVPWEEERADGFTQQNVETLNVYGLLVRDIADGGALPCVIAFRKTSYKTGKKVITHFARMQMMKLPGAAQTLKLCAKVEKNDDGDYFIYDIVPGRKTAPEELKVAYDWYQTISKGLKSGAVKADDSDLTEAPEAVSSPRGGAEPAAAESVTGQKRF